MHEPKTVSVPHICKPGGSRASEARSAGIKAMIVSFGLAALAACAAPPPAPPPPPPPPLPPPVKVEAVPYRPIPPGGAAYFMEIPPVNAGGERMTINRDLTDDERVWHFRSAWNVAALNCPGETYAHILEGYRSYITDHVRVLKGVNDRIEQQYRNRENSRRAALIAREEHMTRVYNFFALPSARGDFCRLMLSIAMDSRDNPSSDPIAYALANFGRLEVPFDRFFTDYEGYQRASAEWDARYGAMYGASQPGWVAVQEARAMGVQIPSAKDDAPGDTLSTPAVVAGTVRDPQTGAMVPVIPVDEGMISQPVVEPVRSDKPPE